VNSLAEIVEVVGVVEAVEAVTGVPAPLVAILGSSALVHMILDPKEAQYYLT